MAYYDGEPIERGPVEIRSPFFPGYQEARANADVEVADWYERAASADDMLYFAVAVAADHTPIGEVLLHDLDHDEGRACMHAHLFREESRTHRQGEHALKAVIEYAFKQGKLQELTLVLDKANFPARRCYAKCGFQQVDRLDEDQSQLVMSLTRDQWRRMIDDGEW